MSDDLGLIASVFQAIVALKDVPLLLLAIIVSCVLGVLLFITKSMLSLELRRYREEMRRRMEECEDAHLARDNIQIAAISLIADLVADLRTAGVSVLSYEMRTQQIVRDINGLNKEMLDRRKIERRELAESVEA